MRKTAMLAELLLAVLLLSACAGTTPDTTRYLLPASGPAGTARVEPPEWIGLGRLSVAPYLAQAGLVVETREHQVRPARFHQWAEPLADGLRRFLRSEISASLGFDIGADVSQRRHWDQTVDVSVDRMHGNLSGEAVLVARWWIAPGSTQGETAAFRFAASQPLSRKGYPGLVDAQIELARQLAVAIAESLRGQQGEESID